jgi:hypothetical protein
MPENSTPISRWEVVHGGLVSQICETLCEQADLNSDELTNNIVVRGDIFGIPLTYERIVIWSGSAIGSYRYALYTTTWAIEMSHVPSQGAIRRDKIKDMIWNGRGDYDRWLRDASLIKLSGI